MGRGSSTTEQRGFGIAEPDLDARHVRRGRRRVPPDVARRGVPRLRAASSSRCRRATCCRSRTRTAPADVGRGGQPVDVREGGPHGARRVVLHDRRARAAQAARSRSTRRRSQHAEPVGDVRQRQRHGHDAAAVPRGRRSVSATSAANLAQGYQNSLLFRYLDTFPTSGRRARVARAHPGADTGRDRRRASAPANRTYGTPDEVAGALRKYEDAGVDQVVFGLLSSTMSRDLAVEIDRDVRHPRAAAVRPRSGAPHDAPARTADRDVLSQASRVRLWSQAFARSSNSSISARSVVGERPARRRDVRGDLLGLVAPAITLATLGRASNHETASSSSE